MPLELNVFASVSDARASTLLGTGFNLLLCARAHIAARALSNARGDLNGASMHSMGLFAFRACAAEAILNASSASVFFLCKMGAVGL